MKKKKWFSLILLFVFLSVGSEAMSSPMVEIQCSIEPINRSKIHRAASNSAGPQLSVSPTSPSRSFNWSGYVAASDFTGTSGNGTVSYAAGSWIVPTLTATTDDTYCTIWVGMDGYLSPTIEQIGTSHNWNDGAQQNFAWFEMGPSDPYVITGFPVDKGDMISVRIGYNGDSTFKLEILNYTKGVSTVVPSSSTMSASALRNSAEWIVEAPQAYSGEVLPLSDFGLVTFNYCSAVINGINGTINDGSWMNDKITMVNNRGANAYAVEAQPTDLLKGGTCFQVTWESE